MLLLPVVWTVVVASGSAASPCKPHEYAVGSECCPKCGNAGYRVKTNCSEYSGTVCEPCPPGSYNNNTDRTNCTACDTCNASSVAVNNCTATQNVRCRPINSTVTHLDARPGHHGGNHSWESDYDSTRDWWFILVFVVFLFSVILLILGCRLILLHTTYGKMLTAYMYERIT
ncbi:membrane glycoprotein UL144 [Cercopithecine betaherpesvirus 5]|uniref:Membrane glycoprotein UL144 n=2 Tax=Simian cytomegalovirus (strain Colburn) TaxID=50292 RepID=G8XTJ4_SCMVC|nr:membrane glycoprotein UL144 [Cercopithecine betaherpesvirus 5]AEV80486.1 membrane glycoprotein UL144 [Cercopithecine betaherpesvirus 5]AEV80668.1 membrane glycoprotein UL144 [Cercopithecine betaherpesvirus 5]